MRTSLFLSVLSTAALGLATDAPETTNNLSASYFAVLPNRVDTEVRGTITIMSPPNGKGADIAITLSGLPSEGGPFLYHIHDKAVPADGNCTGAGAHLDPYGRGETPPCDSSQKQTCQVGDLSGKYGTINATGYSAAYTDHYLSLVPGTPAYFGNRSIVVHFANKTRITCANFIT
ncbi:Cu/Zn superoxide dismutase-related protein, partial [Lophium mytilinum]